jgi:hypothetical protein
MKKGKLHRTCFTVFTRLSAFIGKLLLAMPAVLLVAMTSFGKTDVSVFLLSGQSNMAGADALVSDLTPDQKKAVDSVMIYMDAEGDAAKLGKWLTLGPGFGSKSSNLGPELFFGRTLSDSMKTKIAIIKDAVSGAPLGTAQNGYLSPSSNGGIGGTLYQNMMTHIDAAMKSFDTARYTPRWAGFVWLQGESDAMIQSLTKAYETNLTNLINDIRAKTKVDDLPIILPMIDVQTRWTYNSQIRDADVACRQKLKNVDTMDTKGLPTNGIHYRAQGHVKIGTICAQRWLSMHYNHGGLPTIVHNYFQPSTTCMPPSANALSIVNVFDVSGRKLMRINSAWGSSLNPRLPNYCFIITATKKSGRLNGVDPNNRGLRNTRREK